MEPNHFPPLSRKELVLATLALQGNDAELTPVQVQKLFFIIDREIPSLIGGPHFHFAPYDYGPFDREVYREIESLQFESLSLIRTRGSQRTYQLTSKGMERGVELASRLPYPAQDYIKQIGEFVRRLSFNKLVSSIYKQYPDMSVNSVFRE